jgi:hypothetical protein
LHDGEATADNPSHGFSGFRMLGERLIGHALLELENPWLG